MRAFLRLSSLLAVFFAFQAAVLYPLHEVREHSTADSSADHCEYCLAASTLDTGSLAPPPKLELLETAFAVVAAFTSFQYSSPLAFSLARGPPSVA